MVESKKITILTPPPSLFLHRAFLDVICVQLPAASLSVCVFLLQASRRTRMDVSDVQASRRFYLYGGANHPRLRGVASGEAERSGQMARTKRATMEGGGRGGREGNSFRILYPASATRQPIHPPLDDIGERGFYFDPWWGLVNLRRRPAFSDSRE